MRVVRALPFTVTYTLALTVGSELVERLDPDLRDVVLRVVSTNLHNLSNGHVETLLVSAVVQAEPGLPGLVPTVLALATAELLLGSGRTLIVFVTGHVGASLVVAGLLAVGALPGVLADRVRLAVDTGPSYGTAAVLGAGLLVASVHTVRWALRRPSGRRVLLGVGVAAAAGLVLAATVVAVTVDPTFTDWGHLLALGTGGALGAWMARRDKTRGPVAA